MKLIIGLGNPGRIYAYNRHNIGFMCLNHFARAQGIRFDKKQGLARIGTGEASGIEVILARPQTYMNLSGQSVGRLLHKFDIDINDLLVIHDDLDLPLGKIRIRHGGGSGGHKGVESIIAELNSQAFSRLRVGIGRPTLGEGSTETSDADVVTYVLSDFTPDEKQAVTTVIPTASDAILCLLNEGLTAAMNKYN
jgi:PTH1 family peptidyl-tRNA hydrolase